MSWLSESDYNFIYSNSPRVCVDLIIKNRKGVYLIKRQIMPYKGKWHLPGGRIRFRESLKKAVQRISKTEIGCKVNVINFVGFMEFTREIQSGKKRHSISLAFVVKPCKSIDVKSIDVKKIHPVHYKFLKSHKLI